MALYALGDIEPRIHPDAFVHPDAVVIGSAIVQLLETAPRDEAAAALGHFVRQVRQALDSLERVPT